jgi:hypothetical protein
MPEPAVWPPDDLLPRQPDEERRAAPRHPCLVQVACRLLGEGDESAFTAPLRDVSAVGAGLLLPFALPTRSLLHLDFAAATGGCAPAVLARVVHATPGLDGWLVGCGFVRDLDESAVGRFGVGRVRAPAGDARRWVRFPCDVAAVCSAPGVGAVGRLPARVLDASAGGVGLVLPRQFGPGSLLCLGLARQGGETHWELLRVARAMPRSTGDWFLGCEFADCLADRALAALYLAGDLVVA